MVLGYVQGAPSATPREARSESCIREAYGKHRTSNIQQPTSKGRAKPPKATSMRPQSHHRAKAESRKQKAERRPKPRRGEGTRQNDECRKMGKSGLKPGTCGYKPGTSQVLGRCKPGTCVVHACCKPPQSCPKAGRIGGRGGLNSVRYSPNPKSEGRRPKEIRRPKAESTAITALERPVGSSPVRVSVFGLPSGLGFRPSDFKPPFGPYAATYGSAVPSSGLPLPRLTSNPARPTLRPCL